MKYLPIALACLITCSAPAGAASTSATCEARNLGFDDKRAGWAHQKLSILKRDTIYAISQENGRSVLRASAQGSASMYMARFKAPASVPAAMTWSWKTDALVPGADNRDKTREDAPLRVILAFDGDHSSLSQAERRILKTASLPFATLMYIWSDHVAVETVISSAHTSRVKMLVVASGQAGLGQWQSVTRSVVDDYRRAYSADPGPLLSVAVMTDTDNTGATAVGYYADIRFECPADEQKR